jgi:hypothetical protein
VFLRADDALKLAALLPRYDGEPQLIAVPLSLTMGWMNSPPTFCATSETAADIANASLHQGDAPAHRLEAAASAHDTWVMMMPSEQPIHANSPQGASPAN